VIHRAASRVMVCGATLVALVGCASSIYEGKYAWEDGWREAKVEKIGLASDLGDRSYFDCRQKMTPAEVSTGRFAVLGLQHMGRHRHQIVPVDPAAQPAKGAEVLTNVRRCDAPVARKGRQGHHQRDAGGQIGRDGTLRGEVMHPIARTEVP
jgi:hypothetical protein